MDNEQIENKLNELENNFNIIKDSIGYVEDMFVSKSFLNICDLVNGDLVDGVLDTSVIYKVVSKHIIVCPYDLIFKIRDGYKVCVNTFVNNIFTNSEEFINLVTIKANTEFKLVISEVEPNEYEVADIKKFADAISFNTQFVYYKGEIDNINNPYDNKIYNIHNAGIYSLNNYIEYWKDIPDAIYTNRIESDQTALLTVRNLKNNIILQTLSTSSGYTVNRYVNAMTNFIVKTSDRCEDSSGWYTNTMYRDIHNISDAYDNKLYNIVNDGTFYINTDVGWEDAPSGLSRYAILVNKKFCKDRTFQMIYSFSEESNTRLFSRVIMYDKSGSWNDWTEIGEMPEISINDEETNIVSTYFGKKISIYGDSISTFSGWIPSGNAIYYYGNNCGVPSVDDTWWKKTITALEAQLGINNSWSGRFVSNVRDNTSGLTNSGGYRQNEIDKLANNGTPDVIIIKLGINDFNNNVAIGSYNGSTTLPDTTSTNMAKFREAYAIMLHRIMTTYPNTEVWCCTLNACERSGSAGFPEINSNGNSIAQFNNAIKELASAFGAGVVDHATCGLTYYNMSRYMGDWNSSKRGLHPNAGGHSLIANQTIKQLDPAVRTRY